MLAYLKFESELVFPIELIGMFFLFLLLIPLVVMLVERAFYLF